MKRNSLLLEVGPLPVLLPLLDGQPVHHHPDQPDHIRCHLMTTREVLVRKLIADTPLGEGQAWYGSFLSGRTAHIGPINGDIVSSEILCGITGIVWPATYRKDHPNTPVCKRCLRAIAAQPDAEVGDA